MHKPYKDKQDVFSRAYKALAKQGFERSMSILDPSSDAETCAYRGKDGKRCAVGHLIPDKLYKPCFEGDDARTVVADTDAGRLFCNVTEGFLLSLQRAHDDSQTPERMVAHLRSVAATNGLTVPEID